MKVVIYFFLMITVCVAEAQVLPRGQNWSQQLPRLVEAYPVLFIGERHGNLSNYETYEPLLKINQIDTFFLEWVYDHKQHILDSYFNDREVVPQSFKEAYYLCLLVRGSSFDAGVGTTPITFETFKKKFSDIPPNQIIAGCDHEGSSGFLRKLHTLKQQRPELKICAIDYWDYYPENSEIMEQRLQSFSQDLQHIGNVFYNDYRSEVREIALAQNILECVEGRKNAVGVMGAFHLNPIGAAGIVETTLGKKTSVGKVVQLTSTLSEGNQICKRDDECNLADMKTQTVIMSANLRQVELIAANAWLAKFGLNASAEYRKFMTYQNYVIVQPARGFFAHDEQMFDQIRTRLRQTAPRD